MASAIWISIHAPREGGDHFTDDKHGPPVIFQSTPPARGATNCQGIPVALNSISIHAPREGGDVTDFGGIRESTAISIHAPREGGDQPHYHLYQTPLYFNPRPPRGGRLWFDSLRKMYYLFQSTPPARGATYQHPSCLYPQLISIHAPREGGDIYRLSMFTGEGYFNPRPPRGGRLCQGQS